MDSYRIWGYIHTHTHARMHTHAHTHTQLLLISICIEVSAKGFSVIISLFFLQSPLFIAVKQNDVQIAKSFIAKGADVNIQGQVIGLLFTNILNLWNQSMLCSQLKFLANI